MIFSRVPAEESYGLKFQAASKGAKSVKFLNEFCLRVVELMT